MDYETKLLEHQQLGEKQGKRQNTLKMTRNTIEQLKTDGYDEQKAYSFIKKLDTGLSDEVLHSLVNKYY